MPVACARIPRTDIKEVKRLIKKAYLVVERSFQDNRLVGLLQHQRGKERQIGLVADASVAANERFLRRSAWFLLRPAAVPTVAHPVASVVRPVVSEKRISPLSIAIYIIIYFNQLEIHIVHNGLV